MQLVQSTLWKNQFKRERQAKRRFFFLRKRFSPEEWNSWVNRSMKEQKYLTEKQFSKKDRKLIREYSYLLCETLYPVKIPVRKIID